MIVHVDMDAFYASVEERDRPELVGKPVIVGGRPDGRGVVAAANYVVRQYGVHSAQPTATALRLCPHAVVLPSRMDYYSRISRQIQTIFHRYTPLVEPLSLDEAFLDVTGSESLFGPAVEMAQSIKAAIRDEVQLVASVGVAPNKFLAKLASDLDKPDGLQVVEPERVREFLDPLPISRLWGVGRATQTGLDQLGIETIGQLRELSAETLHRHFGQLGDHFWQLARGKDERIVVPDREAKSISHETTFPADISDPHVLRAWLLELTEQVARRLRRHALRGRVIHIKVRFSDFQTITRSHTLPEATNSTRVLWDAAAHLLATRVATAHRPVRLLGLGLSGLDRTGLAQRRLFGQSLEGQQARLDQVTDQIRDRFGTAALQRGSHLQQGAKPSPTPRPDEKAE